jgi:hypothetical protein
MTSSDDQIAVNFCSFSTISKESVKDAWKEYEAKPEYKEFNKHDMIESMQPQSKQESSS